MMRVYVYLMILAICSAALFFDSPVRDTVDIALLGTAAVLSSGVIFVLLLAVVAIYRAVRFRAGPEIHPGYLLSTGGSWRSERIPWSEIDEFSIMMVRGRWGENPHFLVHWATNDRIIDLSSSIKTETIREIVRMVREKSPIYRQRDVDWEARWNEASPLAKLERQQRERQEVLSRLDEDISASIQRRSFGTGASGMSEKESLREYLKQREEVLLRNRQQG